MCSSDLPAADFDPFVFRSQDSIAAAGSHDHRAAVGVLERLGARPVEARWVESDKYVTAAGVSAGIDMARVALTTGDPLNNPEAKSVAMELALSAR